MFLWLFIVTVSIAVLILNQNHASGRKNLVYVKTCYSAAAAKSFQSYPTLRNPIYGGPPGSPIPGTLQARKLEWVAIAFPNS